ncbi:hypothetical protein L6452_37229 [Arctium lappa]|uniref:Uncharacterized protein n=1 Tax=Arctium lappa TaxID=4217 RepID=A0ACB8Y3G1_ARCLA|nr:hypothetical protein L6452_37229 [Arctium lappa]
MTRTRRWSSAICRRNPEKNIFHCKDRDSLWTGEEEEDGDEVWDVEESVYNMKDHKLSDEERVDVVVESKEIPENMAEKVPEEDVKAIGNKSESAIASKRVKESPGIEVAYSHVSPNGSSPTHETQGEAVAAVCSHNSSRDSKRMGEFRNVGCRNGLNEEEYDGSIFSNEGNEEVAKNGPNQDSNLHNANLEQAHGELKRKQKEAGKGVNQIGHV